ncbi:glycosyltransferase family 2 protein [Clostridium oryzae]|uniref:Putative glycosyltransferase EpsH n=1 Tax=Clostridium oryzae TaxID=1450648 RepID=A0A1V4ISB8_9CLOT|nr:glycosyltransferase [Clostridium oryzae]OPJ62705.1 putative glycosyltransferase EpsH [Clostridium oryzae]
MNNDKPLISVILPAYNVEKYIKQCLMSISKQTYSNLEIIVVVDGATDNTLSIANGYSKLENRLKVIWQENQGSGPARNNGLSHASGKFIMFVDPDDWIGDKLIENMYVVQKEQDVDLVLSGFTDVVICGQQEKNDRIHRYDNETLLTQKSVRENYIRLFSIGALGAPTRKLFKTDIIKNNDIKFPDLRRSQDIVFNYRYYDFVQKLSICDEISYFYRRDPSIYVLKLKDNYYRTIILIYKDILALHKKWNINLNSNTLSNVMFTFIIAAIESNFRNGADVREILDSPEIIEIVINSNSKRIDRVLTRQAILRKYILMVKILVYVKAKLKNKLK